MNRIIKMKLALLQLADELGSVSKACKLMGYSRDSFYRFKKLYDEGGTSALQELPRKKPNLKNRIGIDLENKTLRLTLMQPDWGCVRVARDLRRNGLSISPACIRSIWLRHGLETRAKRLRALESRTSLAENQEEFARVPSENKTVEGIP